MVDKLKYLAPLIANHVISADDEATIFDAGEDFKKSIMRLVGQYPRLKKVLEDGKQIDMKIEFNHDDNKGFVQIIDVYPYDCDDWKVQE